MIKIKIHNDGKQKRHSFSSSLRFEVDAYGESEDEVLEDFRLNINNLRSGLAKIDYENIIYVDCVGEPIIKEPK